jgi:hypothetical protein
MTTDLIYPKTVCIAAETTSGLYLDVENWEEKLGNGEK